MWVIINKSTCKRRKHCRVKMRIFFALRSMWESWKWSYVLHTTMRPGQSTGKSPPPPLQQPKGGRYSQLARTSLLRFSSLKATCFASRTILLHFRRSVCLGIRFPLLSELRLKESSKLLEAFLKKKRLDRRNLQRFRREIIESFTFSLLLIII